MSSHSTSVAVAGPRSSRRRHYRRISTGHFLWSGLLRVLQRMTHYKRGDHLEFRLSYSVRDVLAEKGRAFKDQVEALVQAVQKAGSSQAREEAIRALHAGLDGLKEKLPPEVFSKLMETSPFREAARIGRAAAQRLQKDGDKTAVEDHLQV